jgi:hypothetical protein
LLSSKTVPRPHGQTTDYEDDDDAEFDDLTRCETNQHHASLLLHETPL